jgi:hypothetical protein
MRFQTYRQNRPEWSESLRVRRPRRDSGPRAPYWPFEVAKWGSVAGVGPSFNLLTSLRVREFNGGVKDAAGSGCQHD